ncbi:L-rhamnose-binding lectin CSL1-like [Branchiostoma floridae x Branchiostoma japonicum]
MGNWTYSKAVVLLYFAVMWRSPNVYGLTKQEAAQLKSLMLEVKAKIDGATEQVAHTRQHSLSQRFVFTPQHDTAYACGESGTLQLACEQGKTILILDANYGRTSTDHVCRCSTCRTDCRAASSLSVVRRACQGKQQCAVRAAYTVFGVDPCWGVQKYLEASYSCITGGHTH